MSNRTANSPWFVCPKPNPDARLRLFCFPYAGGGVSIYRSWPDALSPHAEVYAVQPPGRGGRMREAPSRRLAHVVDALAGEIRPLLDKPFAFFGHSMGAITGFELALRLQGELGRTPAHVYVSGRSAPHLRADEPHTYALPDGEFIDELKRLNGTPKELLDNPELMQLMLPLLRADFEVCQTYEHEPDARLNCPLTAFGGLQDPHSGREKIEGWGLYTNSDFVARMLPGDHFFIHASQPLLLQAMSRDLARQAGVLRAA
jgi:medium-chain acyl-[acyl-carrier-protein] hydrolase